jgi:hypothetical protein
VENNLKQRQQTKQLGGITGRGFLPGQSGNPNGRPHTKGLLTALRQKIAEAGADGRTIEDQLVEVLVQEALHAGVPYPPGRMGRSVALLQRAVFR